MYFTFFYPLSQYKVSIANIEPVYHTKYMVTRGSVRRKSKEIFQKVIELRKSGYSYTEIKKETGVAKSTINNWLAFAGLTLLKEHLEIQNKKKVENHVLGTIASKVTRARRKTEDIDKFIQKYKSNLEDPLFVAGIMLYEAEGSKGENNGFSNSDFRLLVMFIKFAEKYLGINRSKDVTYRLYIHEIRKSDLKRIIRFWSKKLEINPEKINVSWKHNIVTEKRINLDYVGQLNVHILHNTHMTSKLLAISDIILTRYQKL